MQSCQVTIGNIINNNNVEFHGIRSVYPTGELVNCFFTVPAECRPEAGDWIGIYPVGWTNLVAHCLCKKTIRPENVWCTPVGQKYGKIEFDGECLVQTITTKFGGEQQQPQQCQFVYVKNGEYVYGKSTPFMFVPTTIEQQLTTGLRTPTPFCLVDEQIPSTIFGGLRQPTPFGGLMTPSVYGEQQQQPEWYQPINGTQTTLEQVVECEMQKLQQGIYGLQQGLNGYQYNNNTTVLVDEEQQTLRLIGTPSTGLTVGSIVPEIMCESLMTQQPHQIRKHWQSRVAEVQQMLVEQIRLEQVQRKIEQLYVQQQLRSYERHLQQVQRKEQEINEYLRAKMQRQVVEFEQKVYNLIKLSEITQQQQPEYYVRRFEQLLKEKVELEIQKRIAVQHQLRKTIRECERQLREIQTVEQQHYSRFHQILKTRLGQFETRFIGQQTIFGGEYTQTVEQQLRQVIAQWIQEQRCEQFPIVKSQKHMQLVCQEIAQRLQDLQCQEVYSQLRIPRISTVFGGIQYPQYEQHFGQVQQLEQQLYEMKQVLRQKMMTIGGQQPFGVLSGEWIKPVSQKLRELEWTLRQERCNEMPSTLFSTGVRGGQQWFERKIQNLVQHMKYFEQEQQQEQNFEQYRLREILGQLRNLQIELYDLPQYYQQYQGQKQQVVELCQYLQTIVREKIAQLTTIYEQTPIECFIQSGKHQQWKQMLQFERKLVQLKAMIAERQQYQYLKQRLVDLELSYVQQPQQLQQLRQQLEQQFVCQPWNEQHQHWSCNPEQFVQQQQKYERLNQLVQELECQEQQQQFVIPSMYPYGQGLNMIQQRFVRLIQDFQQRVCQQQLNQQLVQQIEQIQQCLLVQKITGQQLREKVCTFEQILNDLVSVCQWSQPQQQQTEQQYIIRQVQRQVRELKSQIEQVVVNGEVVNCELNGSIIMTPSTFNVESIAYPSCVGPRTLLRQLEQQQQQQQQQQIELTGGLFNLYPTRIGGLRSLNNVETLIADMECQLRQQRECQPQLYNQYPTIVLSGRQTPTESLVCNELSNIFGQSSLLTTVVPRIGGQQQQQTTTTVCVEPTPYGNATTTSSTSQCVRVQQPQLF